MSRTILLHHSYPVPPEKLWQLVISYGALQEVMKGLISFTGLPAGNSETGQAFEVQVSPIGKLPPQPYFMEVFEYNMKLMSYARPNAGQG